MIAALGLSRPAVVALLAAALVAATAGGVWLVYRKGETAGAATVTTAVQQKTVETLDKARQTKEQTDEKVRRTPLDDLVDGLR